MKFTTRLLTYLRRRGQRRRGAANADLPGFERLEHRIVLSSISVGGSQVVFNAQAGETNNLTISESGGILTFTDSGAPITPGAGGFTVVSPNAVTISSAGITNLNIALGDLNDVFDASAVTAASGIDYLLINGQGGNDTLIGSQIRDVITISGVSPGTDTIDGQGGTNDSVVINGDFDVAVTDTTLQIGTAAPGTLANINNLNIVGGAGDNVIDASGVTAASGIDYLLINGQGGDDTLIGSQVRDIFSIGGANPGTDTIDGQDGTNDVIAVNGDFDITVTDTTLQIDSAAPGTYSNINNLNLVGREGDNIIDASAVTAASGLDYLLINGQGGNDTIIGSQIRDIVNISGSNPGVDTVDGQGGTDDQLVVSSDTDITLTDATLQLGVATPGTWAGFEDVLLQGGASNNVIDASALTSSLPGILVRMFGLAGDDTFRTGHLNHRFSIQADSGSIAGYDVLDLTAADVSPNVTVIGPGAIDGQKGNFVGGIGPGGFDNINEIILPPEYDFSSAAYSAAEGDVTNITSVVEITRSVNTAIASSVDVVLTGNSAVAGSDFTAGSVTVNFAAGEVTKIVPIEVLGDTSVESDETLHLSLASGIAGATTPTATLTLLNDDLANQSPEISVVLTDATFANKAEPGDSVTLTAFFSDPDAGDSHTAVIDWGDGTTAAGTVDSQLGTVTATHIYSTGGLFDVSVTIEDTAGESDTGQADAVVTGARLTNDGVLQVIGTTGRDHVTVRSSHAGDVLLDAKLNLGWFHGGDRISETYDVADVSSLLIITCAGNDIVNVYHGYLGIDVPATILGGAGHDVLLGGDGNDVIVGGSGWDLIKGRGGDDILIGGAGADYLQGSDGEDILIGGSTSFDEDLNSLNQIWSEWNSAASFASRVSSLSSGLLSTTNVIDDDAPDILTGGHDSDWYFADNNGCDEDLLLCLHPIEDELTLIW